MLRKSGERYIGELADLGTPVREYGNEVVFKCVYCAELTGKPDTKGKFYYNKMYQVGRCFRCETIILDKSLRSLELIKQQLDVIPEADRYRTQFFNLEGWTFPIEQSNTFHRDYIVKNRGINPDVLSRFNVRMCSIPKDGIVLINKFIEIDEQHCTDYFQVRAFKTRNKYLNIAGEIKPLSWTQYCDGDTIAVVEGFISAMSVFQHTDGRIHPVVLSGKTISRLQTQQLKELLTTRDIKTIYVITDGGFFENGIAIARILERETYNQEVIVVKMPVYSDPNEISRGELMTARAFCDILRDWSWPYSRLNEGRIRFHAYKRQPESSADAVV
jgi:hypothetical protein